MSTYVVDASVAIKWFLTEPNDTAALRLLVGGHSLTAPDIIYPETANVLWKRVRWKEMTEKEAMATIRGLGAMPIQISALWPLSMSALEIAARSQITAYDGLYIALAIRERCQLVTADQKLYNAIRDGPLAKFALWIEDVP